jgi:hypothetical protein
MTHELPAPMAPGPDWEAFLARHSKSGVAELDLTKVKAGDRLIVLTERTAYRFIMRSDRTADLATNRQDRPAGRVAIHGCTFGASSTIKPDHLFCGGNLEFAHGDRRQVYTTTVIRAIQLVQTPVAENPD